MPEMAPLVFDREVLHEVLMLAGVQEHVQSAALVLHQVGHNYSNISYKHGSAGEEHCRVLL